MGLKVPDFFEDHYYESSTDSKIISCKKCLNHLCLSNFVASPDFSGASGKAYLVNKLINYDFYGEESEAKMITGIYLIQKVCCAQCKNPLGWYYKKSYNYNETYKEGKFVIELAYLKFVHSNHNLTQVLIDNLASSKRTLDDANGPLSNKAAKKSSLNSIHSNLTTKLIDLKNSNNQTTYNNFILNWKNKYQDKNIHFGDIHNGVFLSRIIHNNDESEEEDDDIYIDT